MTSPEENAPKTDDTDQVMRPGGNSGRDPDQEPARRPDTRTELGAELEDKMAEKGLSREDFTGS